MENITRSLGENIFGNCFIFILLMNAYRALILTLDDLKKSLISSRMKEF